MLEILILAPTVLKGVLVVCGVFVVRDFDIGAYRAERCARGLWCVCGPWVLRERERECVCVGVFV